MATRGLVRLLAAVLAGVTVLAIGSGCERAPMPAPTSPNVLWVLWDTVRADHLSLYGYGRPTTPHVDAWAKDARVFDDCVSPSGTTVPSHATMFTGLAPQQHGADNVSKHLDGEFVTLAELLQGAGYRTYLYSANPNIAASTNFTQGFEVAEHPWDDAHASEARRIVRAKVPDVERQAPGIRALAAAGDLAAPSFGRWLARDRSSRPFFAFLNYMEAHQPLVVSRKARARFMSPDEVERSYAVDRSWPTLWRYTFGLHEYTPDELALTVATYDAAVSELDELFAGLLDVLRAEGRLEHTIVILTSDHGEHLGEHHRLDHQYSVYEPIVRVPLAIAAPQLAPGRDHHPVSTVDLFPTILELVGQPVPPRDAGYVASLLRPADRRVRLASYTAPLPAPLRTMQKLRPDFDPKPWQRTLAALVDSPFKYIRASDGAQELYDLTTDPDETRDLSATRAETAARLASALDAQIATLAPPLHAPQPAVLSAGERARLQALGYVDGGETDHAP